MPVIAITIPAASAAAITLSSALEPPGWITAVAPASISAASPSAKGKNASEAATDPMVRGASHPWWAAVSRAFCAAMRAESVSYTHLRAHET